MTFKKKVSLFTFSLVVLLMISSCSKEDDTITTDCTKGEGTITTTTLSIADFTGIDLAFSNNVTVSQGLSQKVEATGHPNIIEKITTSVSNDIWTIGLENGCYEDYDLSIEITVPNINSLDLSGSGNLLVDDFSNQSGQLSVGLSGSGDITINAFEGVIEVDASLSGNGNITASKNLTVESLIVTNSGSGDFLGFEINSDNCTVNSSGSGDSEVKVQSVLDVTISGSGDVSYKGMPTITQDITGSGNLIDAN